MILEYMTKVASETLDYVIDLRRWLKGTETIAAVRATTSPSSLSATSVTYTGTAVTVRLAGGLGRHIVSVYVTTSTGQVKTVQFGVAATADVGTGLPSLIIGGGIVVGGNSAEVFLSVADTHVVAKIKGDGPDPEPVEIFASIADTAIEALVDLSKVPPDPEPEPTGGLSTLGARIVNSAGTTVQLRSINWFGAESANFIPHGIWQVSYKSLIDQIKAWGFNTIRIPCAWDTFRPGKVVNGINTSVADNHVFILSGDPPKPNEVVFKTAFECMDIIVEYAATKGLMIVFDHHRRQAGAGADGGPTGSGYTAADWHATWQAVAARYGSHENVIGADLHNEPHDLTWGAWAALAETCAAKVHEIAEHWLIFVEGVGAYNGESYWWGGALQGVRDRPVVLGKPRKLVYSPHEYGQSVGQQQWLRYDGGPTPAGWPGNLPAVFRNAWGFIAEQGIAPIWIGEFGGKFGRNNDTGAADPSTSPHGTYEQQWLAQLEAYIGTHGVSFAYWSLNPNSVDTGGLICGDWLTPQASKITLLQPILSP